MGAERGLRATRGERWWSHGFLRTCVLLCQALLSEVGCWSCHQLWFNPKAHSILLQFLGQVHETVRLGIPKMHWTGHGAALGDVTQVMVPLHLTFQPASYWHSQLLANLEVPWGGVRSKGNLPNPDCKPELNLVFTKHAMKHLISAPHCSCKFWAEKGGKIWPKLGLCANIIQEASKKIVNWLCCSYLWFSMYFCDFS